MAFKDSVELAAGVFVLNEKDELLLVTGPKFTHWVIPGGHVEFGEGIEECARRELLEETGLRSRRLAYVGMVEGKRVKVDGRFRHFVFVDYACKLRRPRVKLLKRELSQSRWMPIGSVSKDPSVISTVKELVPQVRRFADGGLNSHG